MIEDKPIPLLEKLSYYEQALSNLTHTKEMLVANDLCNMDMKMQFHAIEKLLISKIKVLKQDIQNGIIF